MAGQVNVGVIVYKQPLELGKVAPGSPGPAAPAMMPIKRDRPDPAPAPGGGA